MQSGVEMPGSHHTEGRVDNPGANASTGPHISEDTVTSFWSLDGIGGRQKRKYTEPSDDQGMQHEALRVQAFLQCRYKSR